MDSRTIKLTDLGFTNIIKSKLYDNKLNNGFEFNEYTPPELFDKIKDSSNIQEKIKNPYNDIWQLGILFYKIATFGKSPFGDVKDEELKKKILNRNIVYSDMNKISPKIIQIIDKMLQIDPKERCTIKQLNF